MIGEYVYKYAAVKVADLLAIIEVPAPKGSYVSKSEETRAILNLTERGYRWIRTDGDYAVFELAERR